MIFFECFSYSCSIHLTLCIIFYLHFLLRSNNLKETPGDDESKSKSIEEIFTVPSVNNHKKSLDLVVESSDERLLLLKLNDFRYILPG